MLARTTDALAAHWSGFLFAGKRLKLRVRPFNRERRLRLFIGDIFNTDGRDDNSPEFCERLALAILIGKATLHLLAPDATGDRDELAARDLLFAATRRRKSGLGKLEATAERLTDEAAALVAEHADEIREIAADLARRNPAA